jgi:hypothetical protein
LAMSDDVLVFLWSNHHVLGDAEFVTPNSME